MRTKVRTKLMKMAEPSSSAQFSFGVEATRLTLNVSTLFRLWRYALNSILNEYEALNLVLSTGIEGRGRHLDWSIVWFLSKVISCRHRRDNLHMPPNDSPYFNFWYIPFTISVRNFNLQNRIWVHTRTLSRTTYWNLKCDIRRCSAPNILLKYSKARSPLVQYVCTSLWFAGY